MCPPPQQDLKDQVQDCHAQTRALALQAFGGVRTVRGSGAEPEERRRYGEALRRLGAVKRRSGVYSAAFLLVRRVSPEVTRGSRTIR